MKYKINMTNVKIKSYISNVLAIFILYPSIVFANVNVTGKVTVTYEPEIFSSKPSDEVRSKTLDDAKRAAWEKYTQNFSPSKIKSYRKIESAILNSLDTYIIESNVIHEKIDENSKRYTVIVKVTINTAKFEAKLLEVSNAGAKRSGSGSLFSFIFIARQEESVKSFDSKKTRIEMKEGRGLDKEKASHTGGTTVSSNEYKNIKKSTSGGSTVRKADSIEYRILSADGIDTSMNEVLSASGFEVVDYGDIVSECGGIEPDLIKKEFTNNNSISRKARKSAIKGSRECEVSYFAVGTLDVGLAEVDPVTGNKRVFVSVKAQVWNIDKRLPRKIASVGPIQYQGLGPNPRVAKNNALILAAKKTASEIVNQLNAKELH